MYIVVFREHNKLMNETRYMGPYASFNEAYDVLFSMPALGENTSLNPGVKFIQELHKPIAA